MQLITQNYPITRPVFRASICFTTESIYVWLLWRIMLKNQLWNCQLRVDNSKLSYVWFRLFILCTTPGGIFGNYEHPWKTLSDEKRHPQKISCLWVKESPVHLDLPQNIKGRPLGGADDEINELWHLRILELHRLFSTVQ